MYHTIDTYLLLLLISYIGQDELNDIEIHAYLINSDRYNNIKQIIRELGSIIFLALPFFFAFTGCDSVSSFYGKCKCNAYDVWVKSERNNNFTGIFVELGEKPTNVTNDYIDMLVSLCCSCTDRDTKHSVLLDWTNSNKSTDNDLRLLPPSKNALRQHSFRASDQAGYLWRQC